MQTLLIHRLLRARDWQDRPELNEVAEWWSRRRPGVCALIGIGGAGKTAVVDRFLQSLQDGEAPFRPARLFVFSFYDDNADAFFATLFEWLLPRRRTVSNFEGVAALTAGDEPVLIVLDGFEKAQEDGTRGPLGQITDPRLRAFLLQAADGLLGNVSLLVTSRFALFDPAADRSDRYHVIDVEQLGSAAAIRLLRARGVRAADAELDALATDWGHHALSLDLIGGFIAHFLGGDPARFASVDAGAIDRTVDEAGSHAPVADPKLAYMRRQSRRFAQLASRYHDALAESDPEALALLQQICIFRTGATAPLLAEVMDWTPAAVTRKVAVLEEMRLVESTSQHGDARFSVHPAVRDGFLRRSDDAATRNSHLAARRSLESLLGGLPSSAPSDAATLDVLEEIVHHTLASGNLAEATKIYDERMGEFKNLGHHLGAYERGERICRMFAPALSGPEWTAAGLTETDRSKFLNEWALYLMQLGWLNTAAHCYRQALRIDEGQHDDQNASVDNRNLASVLLLAGKLREGLAAAEAALACAERTEKAGELRKSYVWVAHAHAQRGDADAAFEAFASALEWQHKGEPAAPDKPLWALPGILYAQLLIRTRRFDEAVSAIEANLAILAEWGEDDPDVVMCRLLLAEIQAERDDLHGAEALLNGVGEWALRRDAKEVLCRVSVLRARVQLATDRVAEAERSVQEGLRIARTYGYGILRVELLLLEARIHLRNGRRRDAEKSARAAVFDGDVDETFLPAAHADCGYRWGLEEGRRILQAAEAAIARDVPRTRVFISYSRHDRKWLALLRTHLEPYVRNGSVDVWDDTKTAPGSLWRQEIESALASARVAVLLVSPHFLASDFIARYELPPFLDAAGRGGLRILWIPVSASAVNETPIGGYQAVCDPRRPLDSMSGPERNEVLVEICRTIRRYAAGE